jgi:hypothetical protein
LCWGITTETVRLTGTDEEESREATEKGTIEKWPERCAAPAPEGSLQPYSKHFKVSRGTLWNA